MREALAARLLRRDGITAYTLDVDATLVEAEKREAHWSYQGVKGALPVLGVLFETPVCLPHSKARTGIGEDAGHGRRLFSGRPCKEELPLCEP